MSFLLTQVGSQAAAKFAERLKPLGLTPPDAGILRMLKFKPGLSQQELSATLSIHPSRLVAILDQLEAAELVTRQPDPADRRTHSLALTGRGSALFEELAQVSAAHNDALCAALTHEEQEQLADFLERIAREQGLAPGVHPGYRKL